MQSYCCLSKTVTEGSSSSSKGSSHNSSNPTNNPSNTEEQWRAPPAVPGPDSDCHRGTWQHPPGQ